jgi:hypothetical protein
MKKRDTMAEKQSFGSIASDKERARANSYSDEKRASLINRGMAIIYGMPIRLLAKTKVANKESLQKSSRSPIFR